MKYKSLLSLVSLFLLLLTGGGCSDKAEAEIGGNDSSELAITGFAPQFGSAGSEITINGKGFSTLANYNSIIISNRFLTPTKATENALVFRIPSDLIDGEYDISVRVSGNTVTSSQLFSVTTDIGDKEFTVPVQTRDINALFIRTGKKDIHPRLFVEVQDIEKIKQLKAKDNYSMGMYNGIIQRADKILGLPILGYGLDNANMRISNLHTLSNDHVPYLVLAYLFTKDTRYAERCWRQLAAICDWPDWGANRHFLDTGIGSKACAMAYDGLYDYLTPAQRNQLYAAVKKFALQPGLAQIKGGPTPFRWNLSNGNWNGICHGGLICAALAMYEQDPALHAEVISLASAGMMKYMQALEPDGASEEGMMYWSYGLNNTLLSFESMTRCLGSSLGLSKMPGFVKTGWFPYLLSGPVGTPSFGDDYTYYSAASKYNSQFWYAREQNDANLAKTHFDACLAKFTTTEERLNGWLDFLYYDPELVARGTASSALLSGYIRGVDYAYLKENNTLQSYYIGMHIGDNNANHGHLDAGSLFIQANEVNFGIGNLGNASGYPANYFDNMTPVYSASPTQNVTKAGRFSYYRVRAEGKSTLVINPDARPEQNPLGVGVLEKSSNDFYIANLTTCYNRDVATYKRGIRLERTARRIIIQDEFTLKGSSLVYWILHSFATGNPILSPDKRTVVLDSNGHKLQFKIVSPAQAEFELVAKNTTSVNYLKETAPIFSTLTSIANPLNTNSNKLQIRMAGVNGAQTIRVECGEVGTANLPLVSLNQW